MARDNPLPWIHAQLAPQRRATSSPEQVPKLNPPSSVPSRTSCTNNFLFSGEEDADNWRIIDNATRGTENWVLRNPVFSILGGKVKKAVKTINGNGNPDRQKFHDSSFSGILQYNLPRAVKKLSPRSMCTFLDFYLSLRFRKPLPRSMCILTVSRFLTLAAM
ncbi:unnamed protein product [Sphenostylis stenocarpa]|uniref:Uncharacterized protein n=1 Tax=Sphenostylis stenocarpa TaxID=92480 RepID=A0AA86SPT2_9FABA|nr:unnamed protein product [Sphenostylis stenocarpa]